MTAWADLGYEEMRQAFVWRFPERLNMADQCLAGDPGDLAIIDMTEGRRDHTRAELAAMTDRMAHHLAPHVARGDRVGVLRTQSAWTAAAHLAIWKLGAISVPLFKLFGDEALRLRLSDSDARVVVTDPEGQGMLAPFAVQPVVPEALDLPDVGPFRAADTGPEDPAVLIYTSGTTGAPKGALHGHRMLTGHLPGVEMSHDRLGQPGDVIWTPADWAWIGGLFDVLMPGLALRVPVVAARLPKFTPEAARAVIDGSGANCLFLPPTALRILKAADFAQAGLRSVASGGEPLGAEMLAWGRRAFGLTINEFYGQTECNMVASNAWTMFPPRPGCLGKAVPGFDVQVIDAQGQPTKAEGDIAIRRGAGSMFLGYWNRPDATADKFRDEWMVTGDRGVIEDGYIRFHGRDDDVITSAGYRIGPAEIEDVLLQHPAVAAVGVVGKPNELRTEIVKAYIVLRDDVQGTSELAQALIDHAATHCARHSAPREITFLDALPMTVTGKVMRRELRKMAEDELQQGTSA
ncbi:AMP-binding protein [Paracoccus sp. p3-h83]|uniref:AMP-binding protein n=1 Tax=Paracoccus sp. p3-h83 TaxID=3342805 RepID=UPI0035BB30E2